VTDTTERFVTLTDLQDRLKATPWRHTYNGTPIWELGDDGEELFTIGHVDKAAFVAACDAYYRDTTGETLLSVYSGDWTAAEIIEDTAHTKASIVYADEFPAGEFEVRFGEGDVDVTVWTAF
jgi:hypothetical protein